MQLAALYALVAGLTALKNGNRYVWLSGLALLCFWGLGYANGFDWINYFKAYQCLSESICSEGLLEFEPGFHAILSMAATLNYQAVVFFIAIVNVLCLLRFSKQLQNRGLAVLCFVLLYGWYVYVEQIRQALALSIVLLGIEYLVRRKYLQYIAMVAMAAFFHASALAAMAPMIILLIPAQFRYAAIAIFCIASGLLLSQLQEISGLLNSIGLDSNTFARKLEYYADSERYNRSVIGLGFFLDAALLCALASRRKIFETEDLTHTVFCCALLFIGIALVSRISIIFFRLSYYFFPFAVLCFAVFFRANKVLNAKPITQETSARWIIIAFLIGQAARPFMDPIIGPDVMAYQTYVSHWIKNNVDFRYETTRKCNLLINLGEGNLCE
ncbi:EpsG family protein [Ralstonia sp. RL]|uniref:EpsG family protein n=1 Tax=Ralstonia sp. RL TaxID=1839756 RepID=UPI00257CA78C|nr:EpsG family protein [Ralstonia sp. RL]